VLPTGARKVLDLGAGTGKLTTRLVERGLDVVAVDPVVHQLHADSPINAAQARQLARALVAAADEVDGLSI
jgi:2-polyprenyl-3-methyl-5-hydroxy-6-metoxy-1,4-benzoquinol methylase